MNGPDLDTVATRRATVARELSQIDSKRSQLLSEDEELEIAERALTRLSDFFYGTPVTIAPTAIPQRAYVSRYRSSWRQLQFNQLPGELTAAFKRFAVRALLAGRAAWTTIRRFVAKRVR